MRVVYLSPVKWSTFSQRPHKFVEWLHKEHFATVMWIEPYPSRFPRLVDLVGFCKQRGSKKTVEPPEWIELINPRRFPFEPIESLDFINEFFWRGLLVKIEQFLKGDSKPYVIIGKPSSLAIKIAEKFRCHPIIYDAMDNFPEFHSGLAKEAMKKRELRIVQSARTVLVSSPVLMGRYEGAKKKLQHVPNGMDSECMPPIKFSKKNRQHNVFGYVGTIAAWFDWEWVIRLAKLRSHDVILLIGPMHTFRPKGLPQNIVIKSACDHQTAIREMVNFDVGLIPFKINELTDGVDAIKLYEYIGLGVPVLATPFGGMQQKSELDGVYISNGNNDFEEKIDCAVEHKFTKEFIEIFRVNNSWDSRFNLVNDF